MELNYYKIKYKQIIVGILSNINFIWYFIKLFYYKNTGGSNNSIYCYLVWLKHDYYLNENNIEIYNKDICEIGPGDSIGVGICALILGAKSYTGLDVISYNESKLLIQIFDDIIYYITNEVSNFKNDGFQNINPRSNQEIFPDYLKQRIINYNLLDKNRIANIKSDLFEFINNKSSNTINYYSPWDDIKIENNKYDICISQSAFEYFENPKYSISFNSFSL